MRPFPSQLMRMWPISTRVNKPENDDPSIVKPIPRATDRALIDLLRRPNMLHHVVELLG
jgi:hypothetical protein